MLLDDGGQRAADANAIASHEIRPLTAILIDIVGMKRNRVLCTELERMTDLDACGRMEWIAANGAKVPCPDGPYVCHESRVKVSPEEGIPDVEPIFACSDGVGDVPANHLVDNDGYCCLHGPDRTGVNAEDVQYFLVLSLIHISEPTRLGMISYAVFCL